jgi:cyclic pyranopterin phosphate synthase
MPRMAEDRLTHLDTEGRARMVDVSAKPETVRRAVAEGVVSMAPETVARISSGGIGKGDVLALARIAGVQGAKKTSELIPLCHPVWLTDVDVRISLEPTGRAVIEVEARAVDRTGVEMEAMAGVCAAGLALYDMIKGVDRSAHLASIRLLEKEGGRSGHWMRPGA